MKFVSDNWVWIATPILLFSLILIAVVLFGPEAQNTSGYALK